MGDQIMMTHYETPAEAKDRALHEVRHALGVSIVGAICGASPISKRGPIELRVVLEAVKRAADYAEHNLNEIDNAAWEEANDDDGNKDD